MSLLAEIVRVALIVVAAWLTIVWASGAIYVAVSYVVAAPFVPPRPLSRLLRGVLRECWVVLWTQPMLPLFQLLGRRLGTGGGDVPVVLVHGYFQNRVDFLYVTKRLLQAGCGPVYACNFFWPQSLEASSADVLHFIEYVLTKTGAAQVDLVTHSTGGLFALDVIAERPEIVRRAVLYALPGRGVQWRGPVVGRSGSQLRAGSGYTSSRSLDVDEVPVMSVYSVHDNVVHPKGTSSLDGDSATNFEIADAGHLSVLFDRKAADAVVDFLLG